MNLRDHSRPDFQRVAVLFGGESAEREISLRSGAGVLAALQRSGVNAFGFDPAERPLQALRDESVDCAFVALHGRFGEDGTVQGMLELLKIPYTGSGVMASSMAMDKAITKRLWQHAQLPTPDFVLLSAGFDAELVVKRLGLPMAVKPVMEGSSLGFSRVDRQSDLAAAYALACQYDQSVMAEQFVSGREFTCAVLQDASGQPQALPVIEIQAPEGRYDYQNKYFGDATRYLCPAPIDAALTKQIQSLSIQAFETLQCAGWARADLMWDGKTDPMLLEINTSPGMTDHSLVPMAARAAGMTYDELVLRILAQASLKIGAAQ
ncbi:MAG: D-alanine--D-alanine ligase [Betaproteobacteria bacterium]|jgi:D-alanine-D-alanine ligase|nr:D-alanine--D-alanine ligase [Betaproteobacteria bacterium]